MNAVTLTLHVQELQVINDGLLLVPYGRAKPVVDSINAQIQAAFDRQKDAADAASNPQESAS